MQQNRGKTKSHDSLLLIQNTGDYKDSGREGRFVSAILSLPAQLFQSASVPQTGLPGVQ